MNGYYLLIILAFLVYNTGHLLRDSKSNRLYAGIAAVAAVGICTFMTVTGTLKAGALEPLWFEDILLIDIMAILAIAFLWKTKNVETRKLVFGISAATIAVIISLFACEMLLRVFYTDKLIENRIGRKFERKNYIDVDVMLHKPIPGREELIRLNRNNQIFMENFSLGDRHIIPAPDKGKDEKRIVWLGDSMTEAAQVSWQKRFPYLLERKLGIPHYVLAVGSTSTDFAMMITNKFFDMIKPDVVILGFYPLNDYDEFGRRYSNCGFSPLFLPDGDGFRYNCADVSKPLYSDIYTQPPNALLHFAAYTTVTGNVLLNIRRNIYVKIAETFYNKPNPFEIDREYFPSRIGDGGEPVCSMVMEINQYVTSRGAVFGVVMIPYALDDKEYTQAKQDYTSRNSGETCSLNAWLKTISRFSTSTPRTMKKS